MWPFKKSKTPPPGPVSSGDITADYDQALKCWEFEYDGLKFQVTGTPFNEAAFAWAREATPLIRKLETEIHQRVMGCLKGWPCDPTKAEILCVDLDDYEKSKTIDIAFTGDESWGDFGIDVIITNGKIADAYGGD